MDSFIKKTKQSLGDKARQIAKSVVHEAGEATKSMSNQVVGGNVDRPSPIVEAMQQRSDGGMAETKKKELRVYRDHVERQESEEERFRRLRQELIQHKREEVEEAFKLVDPGQEMAGRSVIMPTSKPSRKMGAQKQSKQPNIEMRKGKQ